VVGVAVGDTQKPTHLLSWPRGLLASDHGAISGHAAYSVHNGPAQGGMRWPHARRHGLARSSKHLTARPSKLLRVRSARRSLGSARVGDGDVGADLWRPGVEEDGGDDEGCTAPEAVVGRKVEERHGGEAREQDRERLWG
jgi:hypothetical protein